MQVFGYILSLVIWSHRFWATEVSLWVVLSWANAGTLWCGNNWCILVTDLVEWMLFEPCPDVLDLADAPIPQLLCVLAVHGSQLLSSLMNYPWCPQDPLTQRDAWEFPPYMRTPLPWRGFVSSKWLWSVQLSYLKVRCSRTFGGIRVKLSFRWNHLCA